MLGADHGSAQRLAIVHMLSLNRLVAAQPNRLNALLLSLKDRSAPSDTNDQGLSEMLPDLTCLLPIQSILAREHVSSKSFLLKGSNYCHAFSSSGVNLVFNHD